MGLSNGRVALYISISDGTTLCHSVSLPRLFLVLKIKKLVLILATSLLITVAYKKTIPKLDILKNQSSN